MGNSFIHAPGPQSGAGRGVGVLQRKVRSKYANREDLEIGVLIRLVWVERVGPEQFSGG